MIALGALIFAFFSSFPAVLVAEILHGSTAGLVKPALAAIGLGLVGHGALSRRLGRNHRYSSFGNAATAALMGALGHFVSMVATFFATAAICVPALLRAAAGSAATRSTTPARARPRTVGSRARRRAFAISARTAGC